MEREGVTFAFQNFSLKISPFLKGKLQAVTEGFEFKLTITLTVTLEPHPATHLCRTPPGAVHTKKQVSQCEAKQK